MIGSTNLWLQAQDGRTFAMFDLIADVITGFFAPSRRQRGKVARESRSARRSRKRMDRDRRS